MSPEIVKNYFREEVNKQRAEIKLVDDTIVVNQYLKKFNWAFVHPYLFGFAMMRFKEMKEENKGSAEEVFSIFAQSFYDLQTTAIFVDGFFKQRKSLAPFCLLIDQAIVLALQKDYAGSINLLIPVIEGSLRYYLVNVQGRSNITIMKSEHLVSAFQGIEDAYVARQVEAYEKDSFMLHPTGVTFDNNQLKQLAKNERMYIKKWLSIAVDYMNNNLYLDTRSGPIADNLNRHSIMHGFNNDVYYSIDNFLRIFNLIYFLSWAFGVGDKDVRMLSAVEREDVAYKWRAWEKIVLLTTLADEAKTAVFASYPEFDSVSITKPLPLSRISMLFRNVPAMSMEQRIEFINKSIKDGSSTIAIL
jgi:hypothetical protein